MFANSFQSGPHVEVFDSKVNKDKNQFYTKLVKYITPNGIKKQFDKETKSYLISIDGLSRLSFPSDQQKQLCLVQRYLVLQIYIPAGFPWSIELGITDTSKTKRRVMLTSAINKVQVKFFHVRCPINEIKRGVWLNLGIDVYSYMNAFKGQTFRSLDQLIIGAHCRLRRIFTMREGLIQYSNQEQFFEYNQQGKVFMPKQFQLNPDVIQTTQVISYNTPNEKEKEIKLVETNLTKGSERKAVRKVQKAPSVSVREKEEESKALEIQRIPIAKTISVNSVGGVKSRINTGLNSRSTASTKMDTNPKKEILRQQIQPPPLKSKEKQPDKAVIKEVSKTEHLTRADQLKRELQQYQDEEFQQEIEEQEPEERAKEQRRYEKQQQKQQSGNEFMISPQKLVKEVKEEQSPGTKYEQYEEEYDYGQFEDSMDKRNESFQDSMDPKVLQKQSVYHKPVDNMFPTSIITKKNDKTVVVEIKPEEHVDLIYDEVLDCYFNPDTNTYYELN